MAELTPREREIMMLVADGKSSKVIAIELAISERTVELHRSRIMSKMSARSVADLVRMMAAAGS
jgi:FixJ family two-component response regulator